MKKSQKPQNPYSKRSLIQSRVDTKELQTIVTKAVMFANGNVSEWVRMASLNYKPITKSKVEK